MEELKGEGGVYQVGCGKIRSTKSAIRRLLIDAV